MIFDEDFITFLAEEIVSTEVSVSLKNDLLNSNDVEPSYVSIVSEIPFTNFVIIVFMIIFLSFSLNILVIMYY